VSRSRCLPFSFGRILSTRSSPFTASEQRQVSAFSITPITDLDLITWHGMRVIAVHLSDQVGYTRSDDDKIAHEMKMQHQPPTQQSMAGGGAGRFAQQEQKTPAYFGPQVTRPMMQQQPAYRSHQQQQTQQAYGMGSGFPPMSSIPQQQQHAYQQQSMFMPQHQSHPQRHVQQPIFHQQVMQINPMTQDPCFIMFKSACGQPQFEDAGVAPKVRDWSTDCTQISCGR
jgi:hypothetical protein